MNSTPESNLKPTFEIPKIQIDNPSSPLSLLRNTSDFGSLAYDMVAQVLGSPESDVVVPPVQTTGSKFQLTAYSEYPQNYQKQYSWNVAKSVTGQDSSSIQHSGYYDEANSISLHAMQMRCEEFDKNGFCSIVKCHYAHVCRDHTFPFTPVRPCNSLVYNYQESDSPSLNVRLPVCGTNAILPNGCSLICGHSICLNGADCVDKNCELNHILNVRLCRGSNRASECHKKNPWCCLNHSRSDIAKFCVHFNSNDCHKLEHHRDHRCLVCFSHFHGSKTCPYLFGITSGFISCNGHSKMRFQNKPTLHHNAVPFVPFDQNLYLKHAPLQPIVFPVAVPQQYHPKAYYNPVVSFSSYSSQFVH